MEQNLDTLPQLASPADLQIVLDLIGEATNWLQSRGIDQWRKPWPTREERDERVWKSLCDGTTWLLWDGPIPVATLTTCRQAHPKLWKELEQAEPAVYVHRLVVCRKYAGRRIGARLLDWAATRAAQEFGALWVRVDVWNTNKALHAYYERLGFRYVRRADYEDCPATTLFERAIRCPPQTLVVAGA